MKKTTLSFWFIAISAAYIIYLRFISPTDVQNQAVPVVANANEIVVSKPSPLSGSSNPASASSSPPNKSKTGSTSPSGNPLPIISKPAGIYSDGAYTGSSEDAYYGTVQVKATINNGAITDVSFLSYPSDRSTSRYINSQATPILRSEAIQAQSANVDIVSGATETSMAFQKSLANALSQAKL